MFRCAVAGVTFVAACLATPGHPATDPVIEALSRDLGLSESQVVARLASERHAATLESELAASVGDSYAGSWLTEDASALVVATTDPAGAAAVSARGARPVLVRHSLSELEDVVRRLDRAARRVATGPALWYVDVRTNRVVLQAPSPAAETLATEALAAAARSTVIAVSPPAELPRTYADIIGGDPFYVGSTRCTIGFSVTKGSVPGFVTAGHCGRTGDLVKSPSGTFQGSSFPGNDYAWVATPGYTAQPYVRGAGGSLVTVRGSVQAPIGSSVCRSGPTTGWHCGTIQQHNATITYAQGTVYGLTRTNVCGEPGDSGGPFISGGQAQGVTSGGSGNCSSGGTTYYQPVNEILSAYGLTLRTA
ncbi:serine protease [Nonomuraea sp. WAC 01424]|uniref:S1 family peptidase n=1 Tax=Nonomuraea sp. WAC 01424 TaxID=2203200 RepID=UPI000F779DCA|nr:S1 family peptidase [Nonomuraea sp. WAC 01424]RSN01224.1 serine protease [Nonomuraea sp. WAC 01424]